MTKTKSPIRKTKTLDCVAMQHAGGRRIYEETKGMTVEEEIAYWRPKDAAFARRLKAARRKASKTTRAA
jgi:hypothetical protein